MGRTRRVSSAVLGAGMCVALALSGCAQNDAGAQGAADFKGKRVTLIIPNSPGQGMDTYGRMIVPYLNSCLGSSDIVVQNIVGAGGVVGTNKLWESEPDGLTIAFTSVPTILLADLADSEGATFKANELTYLGRVSTEPRVLAVGRSSSFRAAGDLRPDREFVFPSQGTDEDFYTMAVLADSLGFRLKIVTGFEGNADTELAVIGGKADGQITALSDAEPTIKAGDKWPIMMISSERSKEYPDVPTAIEVATGENADSVKAIVTMLELHRSFFAPPGMAPETATALREAVSCALDNDDLRGKAEEAKLPLAPLAGDEVQPRVAEIYAASAALTPVLKDALKSIQ